VIDQEQLKCNKCGATIKSARVQRLPAGNESFKGTFRAVAYCCEECGQVLGVESNPLERDVQMEKIRTHTAKLSGEMEIVLKKLTSLSASVAALKPAPNEPPPKTKLKK